MSKQRATSLCLCFVTATIASGGQSPAAQTQPPVAQSQASPAAAASQPSAAAANAAAGNYADVLPFVSRDGTKVGFFSTREDDKLKLYVYDIATSRTHRVNRDQCIDYRGSWSPDGKKIIYSRNCGEKYQLALVDEDGANLKLLTDATSGNRNPSWSPDGKEIIFESDRDGNRNTYLLSLATGKTSQVTNDPADDFSPAWAPDGQHVTFYSTRGGHKNIYIVGKDGTGARSLVDVSSTAGNEASNADAVISPDGKWIGYVAESNKNPEIMVMDINGKNARNLSQFEGFDYLVSWFPDSRRFVFSSGRTGHPRLFIAELESGKLDQLIR